MADSKVLIELMEGMQALYGIEKQLPTAVAKMYWEDLKNFSNEDLEAMFRAHRRDPDRGRFFPKPADLLAKAAKEAGPKHLAADAAWSVALQSFDESASIVWTKEIGKARSVALPVWNSGDKIGARMAFKSAYDAILSASPAGDIPKWEFSAGTDPKARLAAVERAQAMGILTHGQAQLLLPHYLKPINPDVSEGLKMLSKPMSGEAQVIDANSTQESPKSIFQKRWREAMAEGEARVRAREEAEEAICREEIATKKACINAMAESIAKRKESEAGKEDAA